MVIRQKHRMQSMENCTTIVIDESKKQKYMHVFRKKTPFELFKLSLAVMGIELAYSVETAFVSPLLLELGIKHENMTLVWALPPILGLLLAPYLGLVSDKCRSKLGRRRPLIICLFIGLFLGLIFVPYGKELGRVFGDKQYNSSLDVSVYNQSINNYTDPIVQDYDNIQDEQTDYVNSRNLPMFAVIFTIIGTILMDFNADVSQSPIRAYLLEVCQPEDHSRGLSLFTVTTGVGGFLGYLVGGVDWNELGIGQYFGGNVKTVFLLIIIISTVSVFITITSFNEIPLSVLEEEQKKNQYSKKDLIIPDKFVIQNGKPLEPLLEITPPAEVTQESNESENIQICEYLKSLVSMPRSLKILSLANLIIWMSHLSYSLYFTDFVGETVFGGDPAAPAGSESLELYNSGVRFGCWGMSIYCLSCAAYSAIIDWLIKKFRTKPVFIFGLVLFAIGMAMLAILRSKAAVIIFSITAGVDYSTLSTIPYLILAEYHTTGSFEYTEKTNDEVESEEKRGLGMDMAIMGSTIFAAQLILSVFIGWIIQLAGGAYVILWCASILSILAALIATQIKYMD